MPDGTKQYQRHGLETRSTSVMVPRDLREMLDLEVERRNASASSIIVEALRAHLSRLRAERAAASDPERTEMAS